MPSKKWFVVEGEEEAGPLGPGGLRRLVARGRILPGSMIRREDHRFAIRADHVRGLFDAVPDDVPPKQIQGPFHSLRALGWTNTALMLAWVIVGVLGVATALAQRERAFAMQDEFPPPGMTAREHLLGGGAPFLGLGAPWVLALFVATGAPFTWWLWRARQNLPHLITARLRFATSWTAFCWFVPVLNLLRPYQVLEEVDRLSAEALADGDARVRANSALLAPWWVCTLVMAALAITYKLMPVDTAEQIFDATALHVTAAAAVVPAALLGALVFLRITRLQERAHAAHPEPVQVHFARREPPRAASRVD